MTQVKQDKYILGQSIKKQIPLIGGSVRLDLEIEPRVATIISTLTGKVIDSLGNPISKALINVLDSNYEPLVFAVTDKNGNYTLQNIPKSQGYRILTISEGKKLYQVPKFTLTSGETKTINITLEDDPLSQLGIISGTLKEIVSDIPIKGGVASLYSVVNGVSSISSITYTNDYGQFVFREIPNGEYEIKLTALGYEHKTISASVTGSQKIISLSHTLNPLLGDGINSLNPGTVSGIITDSSNTPINRADVLLYQVETNGDLTPVAFTKTNESGAYLFINVRSGSYKVMSNESEIVEVNIPPLGSSPNSNGSSNNMEYPAPLIDKITIAEDSTLSPMVFSPLQDGAPIGNVSGGAEIDFSNGYVYNLGENGITSDGSYTFGLDIPIAGKYKILVKYLSGDSPLKLNFSINGGETSPTPYLFPKTNSWNYIDAKYFEIYTDLDAGGNLFKLHGDGINPAPDISDISFSILPFEFNVPNTSFILKSGATLSTDGNNIITSLGGINDGTAGHTYNTPLDGRYTLALKYLSKSSPTKLRVKVSGVETGTAYVFPKTASGLISDASTFFIDLNLTTGYNLIEFIGDSTNAAPEIVSISLTQSPYIELFNAENTTLSGSAFVTNGMINGLNGANTGSMSLVANVPYSGEYDILINYVSTKPKTISLSINSIIINGSPFTTEATKDLSASSVKTLKIVANMTKGSNSIKLFG